MKTFYLISFFLLVAACFLMALDSEMTPEKAIEKMKELRGPRAVQTVKVCSLINSSIILRIFFGKFWYKIIDTHVNFCFK